MDTTTDVATIFEFGIIAFNHSCTAVNMTWIFGMSIGAMFLYRCVSSWVIFTITGSMQRVLLQFVDIEIFNLLFLSHKMRSTHKSSPLRLISVLEALLESAPQAAIQMVFLLKTGALSPVVIISSAISFFNLTTAVINDDKHFLKIKWKTTLIRVNDNSIDEYESVWPFILLYSFRILDVPSKIISYILVWYFLGGLFFAIYLVVELVVSLIFYLVSKRTDALLGSVAVPISGSRSERLYLYYSWCVSLGINIGIIVSAVNHGVQDGTVFVYVLFMYFTIATFLKYYIFAMLHKVSDLWMDSDKERSDVDTLLFGGHFQDAFEVLVYGGTDLVAEHQSKKVYRYSFSVLRIVAETNSNSYTRVLFSSLLEHGLDEYVNETALFVIAKHGKEGFMKCILLSKWITIEYINKEETYRQTALHWLIKNHPSLVTSFWACIVQTFPNKEMQQEILNRKETEVGTETMLEYAMIVAKDHFEQVYRLYPSSTNKRDLLQKCMEYEKKYVFQMPSKIRKFIQAEMDIR
eukprot:89262_1